jgi:hypothetical protein
MIVWELTEEWIGAKVLPAVMGCTVGSDHSRAELVHFF